MQWRAETQIQDVADAAKKRGCGLYLDLPVGVHPDSYDCWRFPDQFIEGASVGAPPDVVTTSGQNWGFRPPSPEGLRRDGYRYYAEFLQHHMKVASTVRFDHVMGLHRLYWVPQGRGARDGVYVRYHADEIYAVLALESQRHQCAVVGEDLGIVPPEVRTAMSRHNVDGMYVMAIELHDDAEQPYTKPRQRTVASFGTHDLPTFASFWQQKDIPQRQELGVLDAKTAKTELAQRKKSLRTLTALMRKRKLISKDVPAEALKGCLTLLAESAARRVIVNLEDLWLEQDPQNVPGTTGEQHANWRKRAAHSLDDLEAGVPSVDAAIEVINAGRTAKRGLKS
jgi:4-alpha-glucanotransferase